MRLLIKTTAFALFGTLAPALFANEPLGQSLIQSHCVGCHQMTDTGLSRISTQRKTPEGWEMTINRMRNTHGLQLRHDTLSQSEILGAMVKYLADTQGLAPEETAGLRYLLQREGNTIEHFPQQMAEMCGRCHSAARVALQRRSPEDWSRTIDFHLGQWPSTEYSLYGRDRPWLNIAREQIVPALTRDYPLDTQAWSDWQQAPRQEPVGAWLISGHIPGEGEFVATMRVTAQPDRVDSYDVKVSGEYADGSPIEGRGVALTYTGYEWRASVTIGDIQFNQALALSPDGNVLTGRMYQRNQELVGTPLAAVRDTGKAMLHSVYPPRLQRGSRQTLVVSGLHIDPEQVAIPGVVIESAEAQGAHKVLLTVDVPADVPVGRGDILLGTQRLENALAIYDQVDRLAISPGYGVARIGGNGGQTPKVETVFRAVGYDHGPDGVAETDDDIDLGYIDDVVWRAVGRDAEAVHEQDTVFAGQLDPNTGRFVPAAAGPNAQRTRSTNNAGNLDVIAQYTDSDRTVEGRGRLLVTVQRWVNPPLK